MKFKQKSLSYSKPAVSLAWTGIGLPVLLSQSVPAGEATH